MDKRDWLLIKTAEECAEVQVRISKFIQFGRDEVQPGQDQTNGERLRFEVMDLLVLITLLQSSNAIRLIDEMDLNEHVQMKTAKLERYYALSEQLGQVM